MSKKMLIIIAGGAFLFLAIIGGGFYFLYTQMTKIQTQPVAGQPAAEKAKPPAEKDKPVIGAVFPLDTFIVNLSDENMNHYLRLTMHFELSDAKLTEELQKRLPQVRDVMFNILPAKRFKEIQSVQGKQALREEIMNAVNKILVTGKVTNIYFVEFVVQ